LVSGAVYIRGVRPGSISKAGADRRSALEVPVQAALKGEPPYDRTTLAGSPITPMPGALLFALPFVVLRLTALQNLLWLGLFSWVISRHFKSVYDAIFALAWLLPFSGLLLGDFGVGGDYVINAFYVLSLMLLLYRAGRHGIHQWTRDIWAILFGISLSSRPIYCVALVLLVGAVRSRYGLYLAIRMLCLAGTAALLVTVPIYFWDPVHFSPFHTSAFLVQFPRWFHASTVLPLIALAISSIAFMIPMSERRLLLLFGLSLGVMIIPAELLKVWSLHFADIQATHELSYVCPATIALTLWMFSTLFGAAGIAEDVTPICNSNALWAEQEC